jgi:HEAT repeat protein
MDPKTDHKLDGTELTEADLHSLDKVRAILKSLSKYIHGKKLYAKTNPALKKFEDEFRQLMKDFLEEEDELVLSVEKFTMLWRGEVVYESEKRDESLAFLLYKDGIGELSVQNAVEFEELDRFVDILKDDTQKLTQDEDIVTKLWRADFESISYRVLDEYLTGEYGEGQSDGNDNAASVLESPDHLDVARLEEKEKSTSHVMGPADSIDDYLATILEQSSGGTPGQDREGEFQSLLESFFTVSSEELRLCQEEILEERKKDWLVWFIESIMDLQLVKSRPPEVRDVTDVIGCLVDFIIDERKPPAMMGTLEVIRTFMQKSDLPEPVEEFCANLEGKLAAKPLLLSMGRELKTWSREAEKVFEYYTLVGESSFEALRELLGDWEAPRLHREACHILSGMGKDRLNSLLDSLDMDNERIALDMAYLLRTSGIDAIPPVINELILYPQPRVREEIIKFLVGVGNREAIVLLGKMIEDEDKQIRFKVLGAIEHLDDPVIVRKIEDLAFSKELSKKSLDEQEAVFQALGKVVAERALPKIRAMVEKKNIFPFGRSKDYKLVAIRALEHIQSPESLEILSKLAEDSNRLVQSKAKRAIESLMKET